MPSSTLKYGKNKRHASDELHSRPLPASHSRTSTRGRFSSGVNWQFEDQATNHRNWDNVILQRAPGVSPEVEEDYFPSIESPPGSETDSLWSGSDDEDTITSSSTRKHGYSAYRWMKRTKEEYFVSHSGKRSPFLKVNMAPPSPAGEHFKQSLEDLRRNLLPNSSPRSRTNRSRRYDSEAMRSSLLMGASNGSSSRAGFSGQNPSLLPPGSEFYSVSHHYKIVTHHCSDFSCETLTRKQFYRIHIEPERYLRDIWTITNRKKKSPLGDSRAIRNTCNQEVSQLWTLLASAHTLPFQNKFYWQKRKNTGSMPCFTFNATGRPCTLSKHADCHPYCLCCGSESHGASACNVINILEKIMRHYAKKCGMSLQTFEKSIGFYGDTPASVVIHGESVQQNGISTRGSSYTMQLSNTGAELSNGETESNGEPSSSISSLGSPLRNASSDISTSDEEASESASTRKDDVSSQSHLPENTPTISQHDDTHPRKAPSVSEEKPQKNTKEQPKVHRRPAKRLTKEHTKATYEAALHRRSDNSFVALMLVVVIAIFCYFYFKVDHLPPAEYLYDTV